LGCINDYTAIRGTIAIPYLPQTLPFSLTSCCQHFQVLLSITPVLLHLCKSHVCRAISHWVKSIDRCPTIRTHVKSISHIFINLFRHVTSNMDLSDIIVHLGLLLYIFEKPFFHVPRSALITQRNSAGNMTESMQYCY
jgi:hypothetical protein